MKDIRVRYAPSPTGYLHIGNARTALFNYLYAKNQQGKFIIRIEDTDIKRNIEGGVQSQLDNLAWLGIKWDESVDVGGPHTPYNQLTRNELGLYKPFSDKLLNSGDAYKCFCTSEELEKEAEAQKAKGMIPKYSGKCRHLSNEEITKLETQGIEYSIRFKVASNKEYRFNDMVKGNVLFNSDDVSGDFNIVKRSGIPTYNFVVVLDDHLMEITHVLRGEDHISNTPKQMMIYQALGLEIPTFCHMTLIVNEEGKKLSKRDTSIIQFIEDYKDLGYLPEALFNFISLLGWSPEGEEEIFTKEELINIFDINRLSKSSAKFDVAKLTWINNQYLKKMQDRDYLDFVLPHLEHNGVYDNNTLEQICLLYKDQISFGKEINEVSQLFFGTPELDDEATKFITQPGIKATLESFHNILTNEETLTQEGIKEAIKQAGINTEVKGKMLFMPIRIATTFQMHGPELPSTLIILGKQEVLKNLSKTITSIK